MLIKNIVERFKIIFFDLKAAIFWSEWYTNFSYRKYKGHVKFRGDDPFLKK